MQKQAQLVLQDTGARLACCKLSCTEFSFGQMQVSGHAQNNLLLLLCMFHVLGTS